MSEGAIGFLIFLGISVLAALLAHWFIRSYLLASLCAAPVASVGFQVVGYLHDGHLYPLFIVGLAFGAVFAFAVALVAGIPFFCVRRRQEKMDKWPD